MLAYWLFVGRAPFSGTSSELLYAHINLPPPLAHEARGELPIGVSRAIAAAMAKEPEQRPKSAAAFVEQIKAAIPSPDAGPVFAPNLWRPRIKRASDTPAPMPDRIGRYPILATLGVGGMASVYRAFHPGLRSDVAIKVINPNLAVQPEFQERFRREAAALHQLNHPNILRLMDFDEEAGRAFIVYPFVSGGTLLDRVSGAPLPVSDVIRLLSPLAAALDYAHERHIVHRDVKPANVLLEKDGTPVLADFGLVRLVAERAPDDPTREILTTAGIAMGTPPYMAPEQVLGNTVDGRTDQYALGIVAYELLVGRPPYRRETPAETPQAVAWKHVSRPLPAPSSFNPSIVRAMEPVLQRALAKEPDERYPNCRAFVEDLAYAVTALRGRSPLEPLWVEPRRPEIPRLLGVFRHRHAVLPIVHAETVAQTVRNARVARDAGCDGVFLINHRLPARELLAMHEAVTAAFPDWWIGVNCLDLEPAAVFGLLPPTVAGVWVDDAAIDERVQAQTVAEQIRQARERSGWRGLYFGGVAYRRAVGDPVTAARRAAPFMDVVTTSGPERGGATAVKRVRAMKAALGTLPLAVASGITPENVTDYLDSADCFLAATGISRSFEDLDPLRVQQLVRTVRAWVSGSV